jgi:hypothetical protein
VASSIDPDTVRFCNGIQVRRTEDDVEREPAVIRRNSAEEDVRHRTVGRGQNAVGVIPGSPPLGESKSEGPQNATLARQ